MKTNDIEMKRKEIDKLDNDLIKLLAKRFDLSKEIGILKKLDKLENYDPKREEAIFENIEMTLEDAHLSDKVGHIKSIYKTLLLESKSYQKKKIDNK